MDPWPKDRLAAKEVGCWEKALGSISAHAEAHAFKKNQWGRAATLVRKPLAIL